MKFKLRFRGYVNLQELSKISLVPPSRNEIPIQFSYFIFITDIICGSKLLAEYFSYFWHKILSMQQAAITDCC